MMLSKEEFQVVFISLIFKSVTQCISTTYKESYLSTTLLSLITFVLVVCYFFLDFYPLAVEVVARMENIDREVGVAIEVGMVEMEEIDMKVEVLTTISNLQKMKRWYKVFYIFHLIFFCSSIIFAIIYVVLHITKGL